MKIYVYPADTSGCGSFRMIWPSKVLQAQGHDITIVRPTERDGFYGKIEKDKLVDVTYPDDADVVVMQRVTHKYLSQAIAMMTTRGTAVVIDMDDDLSCIHPTNAAYSALHPQMTGEHAWTYADRACDDATLVTVSSERLTKVYGKPGHARVIENYIPQTYFDIPRYDSKAIGWAGLLATHPEDVPELRIPISRLVSEGHKFNVIGNPDGVARALGVNDEDIESTGPKPIAEWPAAVATLGIGLAPLADSRFNASKSWLKPLEYAALGIPSVMSPRAEYRALNKLGVGHLASKPRQWYSIIQKLITDNEYRQECSVRDREIAATMTIELNAWRWLEIWTEAYDRVNKSVSV